MNEIRTYQNSLRKKLKNFHEKGGEPLTQEETSVLVDQYMIDQSMAGRAKKKPRRKKGKK